MMLKLKKNIQAGKTSFFLILFSFFLINLIFSVTANENISNLEGEFIEIKILDKVSSKNNLLKLKINEEKKFKNLLIKSLKCKNSEFDDDPEITAYIQVKDVTKKDNDEVFIFNGWTFASDPSLAPFDHAIYDLQLLNCNKA